MSRSSTKLPAPSSSVAGRINFPSILKPKPGSDITKSAALKSTLISSPKSLSSSSSSSKAAAVKKENVPAARPPRRRTESMETIRAPSQPDVPFASSETRKRSRVDSGTQSANVVPRTRQRVSSNSFTAIPEGANTIASLPPVDSKVTALKARISAQLTGIPISGFRTPVTVGRSKPAETIVTRAAPTCLEEDISQYVNDNEEDGITLISDPMPDIEPPTPRPMHAALRANGFAAKSPYITRTSYPAIPTKLESNGFPVMQQGLLEYHNRFRDPDLAKPNKRLSRTIIPEGLLPPPTIYEPENDDDFGDADILAHITPPLTDHWGNIMDVSARHLEMSITSIGDFIEFWDLDHVVHLGVPAYIHFSLKVGNKDDEYALMRAIPPRPDFRCIDVTCESFDYAAMPLRNVKNSPASASHVPEYRVKYMGASSGKDEDLFSQPAGLMHGIVLRRKWEKVFPRSSSPSSSTSTSNPPSPVLDDRNEAPALVKSGSFPNKKGWTLKMWIPIPIELFIAKESRAFRLKASAWIGDEVSGGILSAETDIVLSHLSSRREMIRRHSQLLN